MVYFSEKDKKEAERVLSQNLPYSKASTLLEKRLNDLKDRFSIGSNREITSFLHTLQSDFTNFGIAQRIVSGNVCLLIECLSLSGRIGYLMREVGGEKYSGGDDCLQIFNLLKMLAAGDHQAVERLTNQFPAPFKKGHPDTVLLCNAVYGALGKHPEPDSIIIALEKKKSTKFFESMYRCVLAILKEDSDLFAQGLNELLKGNRRQEFHTSMEKVICVEAHAMFHLWGMRNEPEVSDVARFELPWDQELYSYMQNQTELVLNDFSNVSPVLDRWLRHMPNKIDTNDLVVELKENILMLLIRRIRVIRRNHKLTKSILQGAGTADN